MRIPPWIWGMWVGCDGAEDALLVHVFGDDGEDKWCDPAIIVHTEGMRRISFRIKKVFNSIFGCRCLYLDFQVCLEHVLVG